MRKAHNRKEMVGLTFNNWQVLEEAHTRNKIVYYICLCTTCNNKYTVDGRNLRSGRSKQCTKCGIELTKKANIGKKLSEETKQKIALAATGRKVSEETKNKLRGFKLENCNQELAAIDPTPYEKGAGLRISTKISLFKGRAKNRDKKMELSNIEIAKLFTSNCKYCKKEPNPYNGIDRIDSSLGYISGNVAPCCFECNVSKNISTVKEFKEWIIRVHSNIDNF